MREGGVLEFLERVELLLMPLPPVILLLVLMLLFVTEDEQGGSRDDNPVPLGGGKAELVEDVIGAEELDC